MMFNCAWSNVVNQVTWPSNSTFIWILVGEFNWLSVQLKTFNVAIVVMVRPKWKGLLDHCISIGGLNLILTLLPWYGKFQWVKLPELLCNIVFLLFSDRIVIKINKNIFEISTYPCLDIFKLSSNYKTPSFTILFWTFKESRSKYFTSFYEWKFPEN